MRPLHVFVWLTIVRQGCQAELCCNELGPVAAGSDPKIGVVRFAMCVAGTKKSDA